MTNTLLAPHLKAEVAQSNAVSPAPSTRNIKVGKIRNRSTTGNIKVGKIRNRSTKAGGKCKNGAETAKKLYNMRSFNNSSADLQQQHLFKRW